ncbi:hypothetical protein SEA_BIG4_51 [Microbacterium phage Big4]|nr:hypothetical protein SEA_BIG4_51 [Microbacterium phage Big4]
MTKRTTETGPRIGSVTSAGIETRTANCADTTDTTALRTEKTMSDIESTTMAFIAAHLFAWDSANENRFDAEDVWLGLSDAEREEWNQKAIRLIGLAEPVWRSRIATPESRIETVGTLQSLARMATVRGIPEMRGAESTAEKELAVRNWIQGCATRYGEIGRV